MTDRRQQSVQTAPASEPKARGEGAYTRVAPLAGVPADVIAEAVQFQRASETGGPNLLDLLAPRSTENRS